MTELADRLADPDDLRSLAMLACVLLVSTAAAVAAGYQPLLGRRDAGFGFRWVKRR